MQTKGLVEVLVLTVVLDVGVIGPATFLGPGQHDCHNPLTRRVRPIRMGPARLKPLWFADTLAPALHPTDR
jgi:hypothetical protein